MLKSRSEFVDLARSLLPHVHEAGIRLLKHFHEGVEVEQKVDASPVTAADWEAEAIILAALGSLGLKIPVVAEEEVALGRIPEVGRDLFLVDALDGTRAFIKGRKEFTINIGLVLDRIPVFGIIAAPATGQLFVTVGPDEAIEIALPPARMPGHLLDLPQRRLNSRSPGPRPLTVVTSRFVSKRLQKKLALLPEHEQIGTDSSIKFCLVSRGEADFYPRFGEINEWDTAAGVAILRAAGGSITTPSGAAVSYGHGERLFRHEHGFIAWSGEPRRDIMDWLRD